MEERGKVKAEVKAKVRQDKDRVEGLVLRVEALKVWEGKENF